MWWKVDDQAHSHPKMRRAGLEAVGLWTMAGSYCMAHKLDGQVDSAWASTWPKWKRLAGELVQVRLWHAAGHDCPDCPQPADPKGWIFHDWADVQPTSEEIEKKREYDRKRQRDRRAKLAEAREDTPKSGGVAA